jgi:hypothetical protein
VSSGDSSTSEQTKTAKFRLFWLSFILLFAEIMAIRWIGYEVPPIRAFPNLVVMVALIATSAGLAATGLTKPKQAWLEHPWTILIVSSAAILCLIYAVALGFPNLSIKFDQPDASPIVSILVLFSFVAVLYILFRQLGKLLAKEFEALEPLQGYSVNLLGSLAGVITFGVISWVSMPPWAWVLILGLTVFLVYRKPMVPIAAIALAVLCVVYNHKSLWSPYSKLDTVSLVEEKNGLLGSGNYILFANNAYFHFALRMLDPADEKKYFETAASTPQAKTVQHYFRWLRTPMQFCKASPDVLVLGAGSGNDVAYAMKHGAQHVAAVEIDPIICTLGRSIHPNLPYNDPKVALYTEDARSFLRYSKEKFDLVEFAYLDPGQTLRTASFLRVDNYVYTVEAMEAALAHLKPDGIVAITFATGPDSPITARLYQTITKANGQPPLAFVDKEWDSVLFLFGPGATKLNPVEIAESNQNLTRWPDPKQNITTKPATDQWPFLYMEYDPGGLWTYFLILFIAVALPSFLLIGVRGGNASLADWGNMFFLGQAFMLVETKSITQLALLFGATWLASAVVITTVLTLAWLANLVVRRVPDLKLSVVYGFLLVAVLVDYFFTVPADTGLSPLAISIISSLMCCLPIFFGSMAFSLCFKRAASPAGFFSANLLGVAAGGLTENFCLVTGTKALSLLALVLYGLSAACVFMLRKPQAPSSADKAI